VILSRPGRSGGDKPGFEAFRGREHYTTLSQHPAIFWHFCGNFLQCPRALTEMIMPKQVQRTNLDMFLVPLQKKGWTIDHHVSNLRTRVFLFQRGVAEIFPPTLMSKPPGGPGGHPHPPPTPFEKTLFSILAPKFKYMSPKFK